MGLMSWTNRIEKRFAFAWSFWGFVLAVILGTVSVYTEFLRESLPNLQLEVMSSEPVLDVRENLPDLEVIYQSQDIAKSGKALSVILIRLVNNGSAAILNSFYDSKSPVEIKILNGKLVRADISDTSNSYLKETASASRTETNVSLTPVILETNEWFVLKLLALHDAGKQPEVVATGKIAGQREIKVTSRTISNSEKSFISETFAGDFLVQLVRVFTYFIAGIIVILLIVVPAEKASSVLAKRKRKSLAAKLRTNMTNVVSAEDQFLFDEYVNLGGRFVRYMVEISLLPEDELSHIAEISDKKIDELRPDDFDLYFRMHGTRSRNKMVNLLIGKSYIIKTEEKWVFDNNKKKIIRKFNEYISIFEDGPSKINVELVH